VDDVSRVRRFNRRWTEVLGLLGHGLLATDHSLTEARVIFELAHGERTERIALRRQLGIDDSFLTRVLRGLEADGLVAVSPSTVDGRRRDLVLTKQGRAAFAELDRRSNEQIAALLAPLTADQRRVLGDSMTVITSLVDPPPGDRSIAVRDLANGDLGWVIQRHGEIYADEYGWSIDFEGLVARIVADFWATHAPSRERAWIAEVDGVRAGCVFCVERDVHCAQLRILLVEPWARGLGIGRRLVDDCIAFARDAGYPRIMLWTNDVLVSARRIYEAAGFRLVDEETHHSFGHDLVGQNWEIELACTPRRRRRR
jgi:DNA-binding MarR family transcriptional regulator/GNAT superfamily N-acetyltransferase